jgi:hypothetical protein
MTDHKAYKRTVEAVKGIEHHSLRIIEAIQYYSYYPDVAHVKTIGSAIFEITKHLVWLWRLKDANETITIRKVRKSV